jgi:adenylylsulfate kinase
LAVAVKKKFDGLSIRSEIIDADDYRKSLCKDLGFTKADRCENIRRLSLVANRFSTTGTIALVSAINPYEEVRNEMKLLYSSLKLIYLYCPIVKLISRDTKGLYRKALLETGDPEKINNLTGINDPFDIPAYPDLYLNTDDLSVEDATEALYRLIVKNL